MDAEVTARAAVFAKVADVLDASAAKQRGAGVLVIRVCGLRRVMLGGGYTESERLLADVGGRLASVARRGDWLARMGDQDFVLLLPGVVDSGQLQLAANKVLRAAAPAGKLRDSAGPIQLVIGVASYPENGADAGELLWAAERALALAEQRAVPIVVARTGPAECDNEHWRLEKLFADAIERGDIELNYQPKIDLSNGSLSGVEALLRWMCPEIGYVSPAVFVPIAERTNHIEKLTWSSINSALQQLAEWRRAGFDPSVAINLSAVCLRAADLSTRVHHALNLWNIPGSSLTLEVTESAVMPDPLRSFAMLQEVRNLGVRISIDDFGTGYSSFAYFRTLPADELKIDRSFVEKLTSSAADGHIVRTVIDLAHRFNLAVVAEGIEDATTAGILTEMGCDIGQGYYFGRPAPARDVLTKARAVAGALEVDTEHR
jgi:predicted signal transduction protein with EAL and GGDEF domain